MFRWFKNHPVVFLTSLYLLIRVGSFFTWGDILAQSIVSLAAIIFFIYFCATNIEIARDILIGEILLDGAGHFFEFQTLILRTWFLGIFAIVWLFKKIRRRDIILPKKNILFGMIVFGVFLFLAIVIGFVNHHSPMLIAQDAMLYLFLLLVFPALDISKIFNGLYLNFIKALIWGSVIFSAITLFMYSSNLYILNNAYYHWFRNIASGKITDLGEHFFRVVLPEHIIFVPLILIFSALLMKDIRQKYLWAMLIGALMVLSINFTRIYFLSIGVGLIFLLYKQNFRRWIMVSSAVVAGILILFCSFNFMASRGNSFGLDLLGIKMSGIRSMASDPSGAIRLALLPDIFRSIKKSPWLGSGLGTTVTYTDPLTSQVMTRSQFDWGYLEMIAELGIIGTIVYLIFLMSILSNLFFRLAESNDKQSLYLGLIAGAIALFVVNITTPALFQGFGVIYFVFMIAMINDVSSRSLPEHSRILEPL